MTLGLRPHGSSGPYQESVASDHLSRHDPGNGPSLKGSLASLLLHALLAVLFQRIPYLVPVHMAMVALVGLYRATTMDTDGVAYATAYAVGAEVLWRMTGGPLVFWESVKYLVSAVMLTSLFRLRTAPPIILILLATSLVPSALLTIAQGDISQARSDLSFNLSGLFCLLISGWFFSGLAMSSRELARLLLTMLAPMAGISALALLGIMTAEKIEFNTESNFATSGGFGPNQVSTILGLGAMLAILARWLLADRRGLALPLYLIAAAFSVQSALTFSRSGVLCAALGLLASALIAAKDPRTMLRLSFGSFVAGLVAFVFVIPYLDTFTRGNFSARYTEKSTTGRGELMESDLRIFLENPLLGVGVGGSKWRHDLRGKAVASHSEATRLIAEHGMPGAVGLLLLVGSCTRNVIRQAPGKGRQAIAALVVWGLAMLVSNAMRISASAFALGLTFSRISEGWLDGGPRAPEDVESGR